MSTTLSSFQTLGVAPLQLLFSAGGVAAAPNHPFLLSGYPCCVSTSFLLRGARKIKNLIETGVPNSKKSRRCFNLKIIQDGVLRLHLIKAGVPHSKKIDTVFQIEN
jgi:hypothetical protein